MRVFLLDKAKPTFTSLYRFFLFSPGHFMGKKSVMDPSVLPRAQAADAPAEQSALAELLHEFLRVALREQVETRDSGAKPQVSCRLFSTCWNGSRSPSGLLFQEADFLLKILESYFQSRKWWAPPHQDQYQVGSLRLGSVPVSLLVRIVTFCHAYMLHCLLIYWLLFVWLLLSSYLFEIKRIICTVLTLRDKLNWRFHSRFSCLKQKHILSFFFPPAIFIAIILYKFKHKHLI